jgi:hypothetical protein
MSLIEAFRAENLAWKFIYAPLNWPSAVMQRRAPLALG